MFADEEVDGIICLRSLKRLWLAGCFQQVAGVIFGQFEACEEIGFTRHEILSEHVRSLKIPALYGLRFGHLEERCGRVVFDGSLRKFRLPRERAQPIQVPGEIPYVVQQDR